MQVMSASDAKQAFGTALDTAQREPVIIRKQNRDVAVLMSMHEYEKIRRLRIDRFNRAADAIASEAAARGLTDEKFEELMADVS